MNRLFLLAHFVCLFSSVCLAQGFENCIQVISASGKTGTQGGLTFSYTVGEVVITTLVGDTRAVTQGFHQPDLCIPVSTKDIDLAEWGIEIFPNPTADFLTVRFSAEKGTELRASVFNLLGQAMIVGQNLNQASGSRLDCAAWQPGVYILQLQDPATLGSASVRFIRL